MSATDSNEFFMKDNEPNTQESARGLGQTVLEVTKKVIASSQGLPLHEAMKKSQDIYLNQLQALEDVQEGIRAVLEKRKPVWKNK
jgi:enoyl-CoA hydratase/carnithine racemase